MLLKQTGEIHLYTSSEILVKELFVFTLERY